MGTDRIRELMHREISSNEALSDRLKSIAEEFFGTTHCSELYREISVNASGPTIWGHLSFDNDIESHKTVYSLPGCSIEISSFELTEELQLKIHKTVTVGFNTNAAVARFAGHDYIAPCVNNTRESIEVFSIKDASDVIDVIDDVCQRTLDAQIASIKDLGSVKFANGESFVVLLDVKRKIENGESVKFSFFASGKHL